MFLFNNYFAQQYDVVEEPQYPGIHLFPKDLHSASLVHPQVNIPPSSNFWVSIDLHIIVSVGFVSQNSHCVTHCPAILQYPLYPFVHLSPDFFSLHSASALAESRVTLTQHICSSAHPAALLLRIGISLEKSHVPTVHLPPWVVHWRTLFVPLVIFP